MKNYLRLNRRLLPVNLALAVGSLIFAGAACTTDASDSPYSGWTNSQYQTARDGFFDGYGTPDAFGECTFAWLVDNYTPADVRRLEGDENAARRAINRAADACDYLL